MLVFFPIYVGTIASEIKPAITQSYGSWSLVHADFGEIPQYPAVVLEHQGSFKTTLLLSRLVGPISAYIFFAMFGLGQEMRQGYKRAVLRALSVCGVRKQTKRSTPK